MDDQVETQFAPEEPSEDRKPATTGGSPRTWVTLVVGVAMLLVGVGLGYLGRGAFGPEATAAKVTATAAAGAVQTRAATNQEVMDLVIKQTRHFKGDSNAPITLIEFSDFQCPYCGKWATEAQQQIEADYVNTGKVRFGYFQFTFLGDESETAAEASECASDQGKFWEFHDYLFSHQNGENQGAFTADHLKGFAQDLGLDAQAFNDCLDSGKYKDVISSQGQFARQLGVQSTPSFLVNGTPMVGAQSYETFQQLFEQLLKK